MPVFLNLTDANVTDPDFWASLNIDINSTLNVTGISESIRVVLTGNSISFINAANGTTTSYTDGDLAGGSFSQFVEFRGNNADNTVSGSAGLNSGGYIGGSGADTFTDSGTQGGTISGGAGNDVLQGGTGSNNISGEDGDDLLRGGSGNNNLMGGNGNDTLFGENGSGNLQGENGDDRIFAGLNTTFVDGGSGADSLFVPEGSTFSPFSPGSTGGFVNLANGGSFTYLNIENIQIACFTEGTSIRTPEGDRPVEELRVGDLVETLDHGAQPVRWVGARTVPGQGKLAPIRLMPGSIGNRQMIRVSPQHRVLVSGWRCELLFQTPEILCAAKHLCDGERIFPEPCERVTYIHIMFDRHEIVQSDGALLESFYAGDHIVDADRACREELFEVFPEIAMGDHAAQQAARPFLRKFEADLLRAPF